MRGLLGGALALIVLDIIGRSPANFGGAVGAVTTWVRNWMDPTLPLIPDKAGTASGKGSGPSKSKSGGPGKGKAPGSPPVAGRFLPPAAPARTLG